MIDPISLGLAAYEIYDIAETVLDVTDAVDTTLDTIFEVSEFCDIDEFGEQTSWSLENFWTSDSSRDFPYEFATIDQREGYMKEFYDNFSEFSGYSNNLNFREDMPFCDLGAFNPETKHIDLNARLLSDSDPYEVMTTIMHESRHAFQDFAINHPDRVNVDDNTIAQWSYNFAHYINPEFDFEAYLNQPIEADANNFADMIYDKWLENV